MNQKLLGYSIEGINNQICLKFGTQRHKRHKSLGESLGVFSQFLKILIFGSWGPGPET